MTISIKYLFSGLWRGVFGYALVFKQFIMFLVALGALFLFCGPVLAQQVNQYKPLDTKVSMSRQLFEESTQVISEKPLGDKYLAYSVRLPKDWIQLKSEGEAVTELSSKLLGDLAKYVSPPKPDIRNMFRVRALRMEHAMSAENWMMNFVLSNGYALEGMKVFSERRVDAQYVVLKDASVHVVRAVAEISGPRMVLAEYSVPSSLWEQERDLQIWGVSSFKLLEKDKRDIEKLENFSFLDIAKFSFPKSWILNAPSIQSVERIDTAIINLRGKGDSTLYDAGEKPKLDGRIDVSLVAKSLDAPVAGEVKRIRSDLESKGLYLGKLLEKKSGWKTDPSVMKTWIDVYQGNGKEGKYAGYEVWVAVMELPGQYYYVRLLTLGRNDDFYVWARNIKAFETVVTTLRPNVE